MKKDILKLNDDTSIDLDRLIQSRMVILANSGGGKSWAIRRIAEQAVGKIQTIIIDPEGEFASLREKHDFILAGKDSDVPVEVRSASMLAQKLLELNNSAVIDLYELHPQDRQRYVKLFCEALVNAPKHLYHPVLIILDEAHDYVPEGKPSEATYAVEALASKGRKRGQCLILASQRISKLSKNASAECNNKLIGRASQDIDYTRAGAELGFNKMESTQLRNLKPGQFYAFGPAISDDIKLIAIGDVKTTHAKVGYQSNKKIPAPSNVIKKVLSELKDLPQEAEKEAKTVAELKTENADLKRKIVNLLKNPFQKDLTPEETGKIIAPYLAKLNEKRDQELFDWMTKWQEQVENWMKIVIGLGESMKEFQQTHKKKPIKVFSKDKISEWKVEKVGINYPDGQIKNHSVRETDGGTLETIDSIKSFGTCARAVYTYLSEDSNRVYTKTQAAVATRYSQNSGGFNNAISELSTAGLISRSPGGLQIARRDEGVLIPGGINKDFSNWLPKLGACARAIWRLMLDHHVDEAWEKEEIASETGYSATSGGFNNALSELSSLGLIERLPGGVVRINPEIINL